MDAVYTIVLVSFSVSRLRYPDRSKLREKELVLVDRYCPSQWAVKRKEFEAVVTHTHS